MSAPIAKDSDDELGFEPDPTCDWWLVCRDMSHDEMALLHKNFEMFKLNADKIVGSAFTRLFDKHPESFSIFVERKVLPMSREDVAYSWETKQHGMRVLHALERCLNRIDKPHDFHELVSRTAETHNRYGVKALDLLYLLGCFRAVFLIELNTLMQADGGNKTEPHGSNDVTINSNGVTLPSAVATWNKFFRVLGLAFVAEILRLQQQNGATGASGSGGDAQHKKQNAQPHHDHNDHHSHRH